MRFDKRVEQARVVARIEAQRTYEWAEKLVHEAMEQGLEWAINSPRTFVNDALMSRGMPNGGADLTDQECMAVRHVVSETLQRLRAAPGNLFLASNRKQQRHKRQVKALVKEADVLVAKFGARRGW